MTSFLSQKTLWRQDITAGVLAYFTAAPAILICFYLLDPIIHNQFPTLSLLCLWAGVTTLIGSRWIGVPLVMIPNISVISILVFSLYWGEAWSSRHIILILILVSLLLIFMGFLGVGKKLEDHLPSFYPAALFAGLGFLLVTTGLRLGGFIVSHPVTFSFLGEMTTRSTLIVITGLSIYLVAWSRSYFSPPLWGFSGALIISILLNTFQFTLEETPIWSAEYSLSLPFTDIKSLDLWYALPGICLIVLLETMIIGLAIRYVYPHSYCLDRIFKMCGIGGLCSAMTGVPGPLPAPEGLGAIMFQNSSWRSGIITGSLLILSSVFIWIILLPGNSILVGPEVRVYPIGATMVIMLGIGCLTALKSINWQENDQIIVVVVLCIIVPITHSILNGFGISLIIYTGYHILKGNTHGIHPLLHIINISFLIKFLY